MESSGSGRISDYPGSSGPTGGGSGGEDGTPSDRCAQALAVALEDIEHCDYYKTHSAVPAVGERLRIVQKKRIVAETDAGLTVGNLPTRYNFLAGCLKDGWRYVGSVRTSSSGPPIAAVSADFGPIPPS